MAAININEKDKRVCVGRIATVHGVKGLVKILPFVEDTDLIQMADEFEITLKNAMGKYILAQIKGIDSREQAEAIKGTDLTILRNQLPEAEDGEYYYDDLIGLAAKNEQGDTVGKVVSVQDFGAGDLLEIKPATGGETYLIPFTDDYVPSVHDDHVIIVPLEMDE